MDDKVQKARQEHFANSPFSSAGSVSPELRAAHALEYIAAQLGQINRKLDGLLPPKSGDVDGGQF